MFKSHLEMIGSYEPISKKARFFNTYLKSLKGSQDIMAKEKRSYSSTFESQSIYSDSKFACERVKSPGYHYNPVSKDTYGVTPRKINARDFTSRDEDQKAIVIKIDQLLYCTVHLYDTLGEVIRSGMVNETAVFRRNAFKR